jgi:anion-transporting  ArsA/GET3 family ATPase
VGKTTMAAALSLALARQGHATLIVTIDPARRLAGALGVPITDEVTRVTLPEARGKLSALMPDPRRSLKTFIEQLFEGEPAARDRILNNDIYRGFADAAAGVHELVAMNLVAHATEKGAFEVVVIDTAPSRHAIDFITYPGRLAAVLGGRVVTWLSSLAQSPDDSFDEESESPDPEESGYLEKLLGRVTGPVLARETGRLFRDLSFVRGRFVALTRRASNLLLGPRASYTLVAAPTAAAHDDVLYLAKRLQKLGHKPRAVVLNHACTRPAPFLKVLQDSSLATPAIHEVLGILEAEQISRTAAADKMASAFSRQLKGVPQVRLSHVEAQTPEIIVQALSEELEPCLSILLPPLTP